ncbi:MAG: hypothetical protein J7M14_01255 [Planctomycetes bacterium]|nr:hypothetical protein [Planctomycetota bacterium]
MDQRVNQAKPHADSRSGRDCGLGWYLLVLGILEAGLFLVLISRDPEDFRRLVWRPDTETYVSLAKSIVETGRAIPSIRSLGYPLFLSGCMLLGGPVYYPHVAVAVQLELNLVLAAFVWRLLAGLEWGIRQVTIRAVTLVVFVAGVGQALFLLSDFLNGVLFGVFFYGLVLKRTWPWALVSGACLLGALITRPTFVLFIPLLPLAVFLAGRVKGGFRRSHVAAIIALAMLGCGINVVQQRVHRDSIRMDGPLGVSRTPLTHHLYYIYKLFHRNLKYPEVLESFRQEVAGRAGHPYEQLTRCQREQYACTVTLDDARRHPRRYLVHYVVQATRLAGTGFDGPMDLVRVNKENPWRTGYLRFRRAALLPAWGVLWALCLFPPIRRTRRFKAYYLLATGILVYLVLISAMLCAGPRMKYAAMICLAPLGAINAQSVVDATRRRFRSRAS